MLGWKRVQARFIGEDGSLGYRTQRVYTLWVRGLGTGRAIYIRRQSGFGWCPYATEDAFRRNWVTNA